MALTKRQVDAASYGGTNNARRVLWDDDPRGLGLRIFPSGRKAWVLSYRFQGRKRLMDLGALGVLTLDQARQRAKRELRTVEDAGADPMVEKRKRALEAKTGTVEHMFRAYVEARRTDVARPLKSHQRLLDLAELHIFRKFGSRPWRDVRRSEVRDWHAGIAKPYAANRALQWLRAAFYWRLWQDDDNTEQAKRDTRNPCAGIPLRPERARAVRLELADLPKLEKAIDVETEDPYLRAFFRFVLATGCRRGEAQALRWEDVGPQSVTFRDVKAGGDRTVPLSTHAARLLKALPRIEGNPFVFVGWKHGTHLVEPNKAWQRIRKTAGLPGLRIHDLRRTFGSWLGDSGFTSKQIGTVLGHRTDITSRVYMSLGEQTTRSAVNAVQSIMRNARKPKGKRKAKVLQFRRRVQA